MQFRCNSSLSRTMSALKFPCSRDFRTWTRSTYLRKVPKYKILNADLSLFRIKLNPVKVNGNPIEFCQSMLRALLAVLYIRGLFLSSAILGPRPILISCKSRTLLPGNKNHFASKPVTASRHHCSRSVGQFAGGGNLRIFRLLPLLHSSFFPRS